MLRRGWVDAVPSKEGLNPKNLKRSLWVCICMSRWQRPAANYSLWCLMGENIIIQVHVGVI